MKGEKLLFILLLLITTLFISFAFTGFLKLNMFDKNSLGFQYLFFSLLISFAYFSFRYLRFPDAFITASFLAVIYAFLINKTSLALKFNSFIFVIIYALLLFNITIIIFRLTWFNIKNIRNIMFTILATFGYMLVHLITSIMLHIPIKATLILAYFKNGFIMLLIISFAVALVEIIFKRMVSFFTPAELIRHENNNEVKIEIEDLDKN